MARSESVPTSRRLRLVDRQQPDDLDRDTLDELASCLGGDEGDDRVDAVELTFDHSTTTKAIDALERLEEADCEVAVRELVVEVSR